ncbi:MAG: DUF1080 domain-containing protein [Dysgonamonadaceae bacterium]|jgi:hypothetical protein|nr:DUF1080 domain-containing protein [Dysgonamonadaceae bacterium]
MTNSLLGKKVFFTVLLCCFSVAISFSQEAPAPSQTPESARVIFTGFAPLSEEELQNGTLRIFDGVSTFGWGGNARVQSGALHFTGNLFEDSPFYFFFAGRSPLEGTFAVNTTTGIFTVDQSEMTSLFDGRILTGWRKHGTVEAFVEDRVIRLTKGGGSLETVDAFADFILQLEYYTPVRPVGEGVNSGVFFRSIPGERMNGYEAQILNNPSERDYQNFIGTETGGIFRRQIARNVAPKDGEWNYLTIIARGARMATWVNGIQVTDWTDEREPHNNPRNGLRTQAGTIQLQGHDPETVVLFRNIRIKEL